jgi:hypothetical protein
MALLLGMIIIRPNDYYQDIKKTVDEIFNTDELIFDESCWIYKKIKK